MGESDKIHALLLKLYSKHVILNKHGRYTVREIAGRLGRVCDEKKSNGR